jgi:hypothetical protein
LLLEREGRRVEASSGRKVCLTVGVRIFGGIDGFRTDHKTDKATSKMGR